MVATKYFQGKGYNVESYYYLVKNRIKREKMSGFSKSCHIFGDAKVCLLIAQADEAFRSVGGKFASGDPDLFVYNEYTGDRFFVDVKENDQITRKSYFHYCKDPLPGIYSQG
jgi:hypothetical protein